MKNQVEKNKAKQNQNGAGLSKTEQPVENKPNRLVLPLGQTIFLPQTAMGVSYIDKVRTRVYLDSVQRQPEAVLLRGFYEIDLEYHGLEGNRLYKHRVMLPLRVELPADWLAPLVYEPEDLHVVITKPMLCILSPYVLEFGSGLAVEYVGDRLYREEKTGEEQPKEMRSMEIKPEELPSKETQSEEIRERLESKFGSPGQPKPVEELLQSTMQTSAESAATPAEETAAGKSAKKAEPNSAAKERYHLPVWTGHTASEKAALAENIKSAASLPPESVTPDENSKSVKSSAPVKTDKPLEALPVNHSAASTAAEKFAEQSRLRTMLTVAAISRLQAKGEILTGAAKQQAQEVILLEPKTEETASKDVASMPISVQVAADGEPQTVETTVVTSDKVEMEVEQTVAEITEPKPSENLAETMAAVPETAVAAAPAEAKAETAAEVKETAAEIREKTNRDDEASAVEPAPEDAAAVMAEPAADEPAATAEVYADELAAAVTAAAGQVEPAAETAETMETAAEAENTADSRIKAVNADGVRLRVGSRDAQKIRPVPRPADEAGSSQTASNFCLKYYVVKPGDDPMSIALKHNVPLERLRESNKAMAGDLTVGMVLRIPC